MGQRVLIVDDDPEVLEVYTLALSDRVLVDTACSGEEGLRSVRMNGPYAVIVSDQHMPRGMSGFDFLAQAKELSPATVCIILTGQTNLDVAIAAVNSGQVFRFLQKPCRIQVFEECIEAALTQHRLTNVRHRQLEQLLASIPSILVGISEDDSIIQWNRAAEELFGLAAADVVGQPFETLGVSWDWPVIVRAVKECHAGSGSGAVRLDGVRYTRGDGVSGLLGLSLTQLASTEEELSGVLILGADITERSVMEAQLRQAQKLESIGQLAAGIAHEINTPTQYVGDNTRFLRSAFSDVLGFIQEVRRLTECGQDEPGTRQLVDEVKRAMGQADMEYLIREIPAAIDQSLEGIESVSRIVRAMKEFSHPGTKKKQPVDLNRAIEGAITVARNEWKHVAHLVTDFDPQLPPIPCLVDDITQVILNLIINAAHAVEDATTGGTQGKRTIAISTRGQGDWVEIRVSDTGVGIAEDVKSKIFDPFFTTKEVGRGTGQGLSIAHNVVAKKHGGTITVDTAVGEGTTFLVRLPMVERGEAVEAVVVERSG